jgi:hypothetical protein
MLILFLHGWQSTPGGVKPTYLKNHGHTVLNPALPDDDFDAAMGIAQAEFDQQQPDVVVGSSRGGAVAINIDSGNHAAGPALPSVETLVNGHDGQTRHRDPAQPGRRDRAVCRFRGTGQEQCPALGVADRGGQRSQVGVFDAQTVDECMKSIQDDPWFVLA